MVGGEIIGVAIRSDWSHATLNVQGNGCEQNDFRSVNCKTIRKDTGTLAHFEVGDQVWWQCGVLYWSPRRTGERDVAIELMFHT